LRNRLFFKRLQIRQIFDNIVFHIIVGIL